MDDLQLFDHDNLRSFVFYKREADDKVKREKKEVYTPTVFTDPFSILYIIRGLDHTLGKEYEVPMMNKGKVLMMHLKMDSVDEVHTDIGSYKATKIIASSQYSGDTIKSGNMTFWYTLDEKKILVPVATILKSLERR